MDNYSLACLIVFTSAVLLWLILSYVEAPYGKRDREGWGPAVPIRLSWLLLELPSLLVPLWLLSTSDITLGWPASVLLAFWLLHYFHRSFIYPLSLRTRPGASFKLVMLVLGAPMNVLISWMIATMVLTSSHLQQTEWLSSPQFVSGVLLFLFGFGLAKWSDGALRALRQPGDSAYYIPQGGFYRYISCPNYLGEILQWTGFALASWTFAGLAFALFTAANLAPRAQASHRWYQSRFPDYPSERKALIPYLL